MDSIPSMTFSENLNYWQDILLEVIRQNIAEGCQQTFENKKFVDITQQWFAFTFLANSPTHNLNFNRRWRWWDRIQATFWNIFYFTLFKMLGDYAFERLKLSKNTLKFKLSLLFIVWPLQSAKSNKFCCTLQKIKSF